MSKQTRRCSCLRCGSIFFTEMKTKVYCQESCRKSAERARYWVNRRKEQKRGQVPGA